MQTQKIGNAPHGVFDEHKTLNTLRHYLPTQSPLKDFVHHNTLHAFQDIPFHEACARASRIFGYKTTLSLGQFRELYNQKRIQRDMLEAVIKRTKGPENLAHWLSCCLENTYDYTITKRIGRLHGLWKSEYHFDMDSRVHPKIFRILNNYLDQGMATAPFPLPHLGLWEAIGQLERESFASFFRTKTAREYIKTQPADIKPLLQRLVGDERLFGQYIFDQQFAHPGWSGMVAVTETQPGSLLDPRKAKLTDLIALELLFEIDALDHHFKNTWQPLAVKKHIEPFDIFKPATITELNEVLALWQEAFEWGYHDQVLAGLVLNKRPQNEQQTPSFQAFFCLDDRPGSVRQYLESLDSQCETLGTPGHFGLSCYFQPENGKFYTKICPAPQWPKHLIKEIGRANKNLNDAHFSSRTHGLVGGFLVAQTMGFWSALKLAWSIFKPTESPAAVSPHQHMDSASGLTIECTDPNHREDGLQVGFTVEEMAARVENLLRTTGLVTGFAPLVYLLGHGSSSVNNTYYAGYDCGACSGRPGSVNARAMAAMANDRRVRGILRERNLRIPDGTQFVGGLYDTSRDEVVFYDEKSLSIFNRCLHERNIPTFKKALDLNAKERARRFALVDCRATPETIHKKVKLRTVSLFEPRPELNHATNALCIVGRRELTKNLFLDRRSFLNSYDYRIDPLGKLLGDILDAAIPVCGGINLEYYFSRVDPQKLGAGSKLPHNVMGLIGVANGIEGDLRTGLPTQMTEAHDPVRLMLVVEHEPQVVLDTMQRNPVTYEWVKNEWVKLAVFHPVERTIHLFEGGKMQPYKPLTARLEKMADISKLAESTGENLPVYFLN